MTKHVPVTPRELSVADLVSASIGLALYLFVHVYVQSDGTYYCMISNSCYSLLTEHLPYYRKPGLVGLI